MEKIPMEWVDKLFNCMEQFYGERWTRYFDKPHAETFNKTMWANGLSGLTYDEIKFTLALCKKTAENPDHRPPHVMEFYGMALKKIKPYILENKIINTTKCDPEVQKAAMDEIRKRLGKTSGMDVYKQLAR